MQKKRIGLVRWIRLTVSQSPALVYGWILKICRIIFCRGGQMA